ncbi:MAG: ATP-binding protein [Erythrobacter sp.]|uniref:two-component system sensor histidine kinase NtrB n=1 Tax=Erythrobacter sp. TaxID=1042 RepID=UPI00261BB543|nr:ATP-binding protein [Erythrobacter sp.]MDJ0977754.1 ATP-binding protein [Erythrobacter sp.]
MAADPTARDTVEHGEGDGSKALEPAQIGPIPGAESQIAGLVFALLLIDPHGRIAQVNNATETLLGTSAKRLLGKPFERVITPLDTRVANWLASGEGALVARDVRVGFSGSETSVNLTMSAVAAHPGWRVVTVSQLGHEKASSEDKGPAAVGAPSILAHEIKNPLAAIKGAAQLIARKLPHGDKPLARMITDEVDRIARLIDRMQQLGSQSAQPREACNPHVAIRSAVATVRAGGMEGVELVEEFDPSIPPVLAHRDALEQVLINLISNARDAASKAALPGGETPRITIRTRYVSGLVFSAIRLGRTVRLPIEICVSDNGAGVDPGLHDRLFEPFVSTKQSGQGLGLALVRKLMRDMDGSISHERDARKGLTHFRLHLPVAERSSEKPA